MPDNLGITCLASNSAITAIIIGSSDIVNSNLTTVLAIRIIWTSSSTNSGSNINLINLRIDLVAAVNHRTIVVTGANIDNLIVSYTIATSYPNLVASAILVTIAIAVTITVIIIATLTTTISTTTITLTLARYLTLIVIANLSTVITCVVIVVVVVATVIAIAIIAVATSLITPFIRVAVAIKDANVAYVGIAVAITRTLK